MYSTINSYLDQPGCERRAALSRALLTSRHVAKVMFALFVIVVALAVPVVAAPLV
jgi:hypothetical protein